MVRPGLYATLAAAVLALPAYGQTDAVPPSDYALVNARIVVEPGNVIERGTIRVSDGRIAEVGADVTVPEGVVTLDMIGRTVYPGLIDVATSVGLPPVSAQGGRGGRGGGGSGGSQADEPNGREPPPHVRPGQMAADVFAPSASALESLRATGVTTLGLAFETGGIFPGQVSAVSTGSGDPSNLVLRTPVAFQVTFGSRPDGYPRTLMGAIAYIKQAFLDAEHEARATAAFEQDPASALRPSYDAEHRALAPVAAGTLPVWFVGETDRDLDRIADLAAEMGVQNYTVLGAQQGWKATDLLSAVGRPVIVSLDFPEPDDVTARTFELHVAPASGEDTAGEEADSAAARAARGNAAALARAGVPFALSSYGLDSPADFRDAIFAAVEAGLTPDDALRALTITPATVLGLETAIGTIEAGKLANLVVVEGDLFADSARIREVFVEGERFEIRDRPAGRARGGEGITDVDVAGNWTGTLEGPSSTIEFTLTLERDGDAVTGSLTSEMGTADLSGEVDGAEITLRGTVSPPGVNAMDVTVTGTVEGDELEGAIVVQGMAEMPFNARRQPGQYHHDTHAIHGGRQ